MSAGSLAEAPIPAVRDGVFFTRPDALPRGRHKLSREQVTGVQLERLLTATTELLAARGYRGFGPGDVASRAGVSLAAFYGCFENKDAAVFAGYDRFTQVLLSEVRSVDAEALHQPELTRALLAAYLETLQSDLVVARAYQVEIDALGPPARERRRNALTLFAAYIRELTERHPRAVPLSPSAYIGVVAAARQLAADALDVEDEPDLVALGRDLEGWLAELFRPRRR